MEELTYNGICFERIFDCKDQFFKTDEELNVLYANFALYLKEQGLTYDIIYKILQIKAGLTKPDEMHGNQFIKQLIDSNNTMPCYEFYNKFDSNNLFCRVCPSCPIDANQFYDLEVDILLGCLKKPAYIEIVNEELSRGPLFNSVITDDFFKKNPGKMMPAFAIPITRLYFENMILEKHSLDEFVAMIGNNFGSVDLVKDLVIKFVTRMQFSSKQSINLSSKKKLTDACKKIHSVFGPTAMFPPAGFVGKKKKAGNEDIGDGFEKFFNQEMDGLESDNTDSNDENVNKIKDEPKNDKPKNNLSKDEVNTPKEYNSINDFLSDGEDVLGICQNVEQEEISVDSKEKETVDRVVQEEEIKNNEVVAEINDGSIEGDEPVDNDGKKNVTSNVKNKNVAFSLRSKIDVLEGAEIVDIEENPSFISNFENGLINDGYMVCDIYSDDDGRNYIVSYVNKYGQFFKFSTDFNLGMDMLCAYIKSQKFKIYVSNPYVLCNEFYVRKGIIPAAIYSVYRLYTSLYDRKKYLLSDAILNVVGNKKQKGNIDLFYLSNYKNVCTEYIDECRNKGIYDEVIRRMNADILFGTSLVMNENDVSFNLIAFTPNGNLKYLDSDFEVIGSDVSRVNVCISLNINDQDANGFDKSMRFLYEQIIGLYVQDGRLKKCCPRIKRLKSNSVILEVDGVNEYNYLYDLIVYYSRKIATTLDCLIDLEIGKIE